MLFCCSVLQHSQQPPGGSLLFHSSLSTGKGVLRQCPRAGQTNFIVYLSKTKVPTFGVKPGLATQICNPSTREESRKMTQGFRSESQQWSKMIGCKGGSRTMCILVATKGQMETGMQMKGESRTWGGSELPRKEHTKTDAQDHGYTKHSEKVPSKGLE